MPAFIVRQPNGLLCRFSTVVDCPTHWNMTDEEYIEMCAEKAREEAREEARYVLDKCLLPFDEIKKRFYPLNMTKREFKKLVEEMERQL